MLPTQKWKANEFANENRLKVFVTKYTLIISPKTVDHGFFSKKYTAFTVKTSPFGYEVERRFNDFYWLRNSLVVEYPGIYVF